MMKILILLAIVSYALAFTLALPFNNNGKKVSNAEVKGFADEFQAKPTEGEDKEGSSQRKTCDYVIHQGTRCQK